jgi:hypothetical protein
MREPHRTREPFPPLRFVNRELFVGIRGTLCPNEVQGLLVNLQRVECAKSTDDQGEHVNIDGINKTIYMTPG